MRSPPNRRRRSGLAFGHRRPPWHPHIPRDLLYSRNSGRIVGWRRGFHALVHCRRFPYANARPPHQTCDQKQRREPLAQNALFHHVAPSETFAVIATRAVSEKWKPLSMTSEVMGKRDEVERILDARTLA